jgi:ribosome-associated translation inhibitor RaiA
MQIPLQIAFKNTQNSDLVEDAVRERIGALERFHPHIISCRVVIEVPNRKPGSAKPPLAIALHVSVPGHVFVAREVQDIRESKNDRWAFIGRAFEAMERQLDDHQRIRAHNVKNHESAGETGRVVRLSPGEDSGFIEVKGGPDLYFTRHACNGDFDTLEIGSLVRVTRAAAESPFGPQASSVQRLGVETARA